MVEEYSTKYDAATSKKSKTVLTEEIVTIIKSGPGRFLAQENGVWLECDDSIARTKVSQLFRSRRKSQSNTSTSNGLKGTVLSM